MAAPVAENIGSNHRTGAQEEFARRRETSPLPRASLTGHLEDGAFHAAVWPRDFDYSAFGSGLAEQRARGLVVGVMGLLRTYF